MKILWLLCLMMVFLNCAFAKPTKRTYSDVVGKKEIRVQSDCVLGSSQEGEYGTCTHTVLVKPSGKRFTLTWGETIFLTSNGVITSYEYPCCTSPGEMKFYSDEGTLIGEIITNSSPPKDNKKDRVTAGVINGTPHLVVLKNPKLPPANLDNYVLISTIDPKFREEIIINYPKLECGWFLEKTTLIDKTLHLDFGPIECGHNRFQRQCVKNKNSWTCSEKPKS